MKVLTFVVAILLLFSQASSSGQALGRQKRSASNDEVQIITRSGYLADIEAARRNAAVDDILICDGGDCSIHSRFGIPGFLDKAAKIGGCLINVGKCISDKINEATNGQSTSAS